MSLDWEERPWGSWHVIDEGDGYKVKRIVVDPAQRLSYQTHDHRAEHWSGVAARPPASSTARPWRRAWRVVDVGRVRRTGSPTPPLHHPPTGEDDIVSIEDDYGRYHAGVDAGPSATTDVARQ